MFGLKNSQTTDNLANDRLRQIAIQGWTFFGCTQTAVQGFHLLKKSAHGAARLHALS
jgi:hypothetical protein